MKLRSCISRYVLLTLPVIALISFPLNLPAQEITPPGDGRASLDQTVFSRAVIRWEGTSQLPADIRLDDAVPLNEEDFFTNLRQVFALPDQLEFIPMNESKGSPGERHIRYTQHYRGVELARTQYMVHMKEGRVVHAHGPLTGKPEVGLVPALDKEEAFRLACSHLDLSPVQALKNNAFMSSLSRERDGHRANGDLLLSSGRLVYSFDIATRDPLGRYDVEIEAHTGELAGIYPTLYHENIPTTGNSLYNGEVDIVVSDTINEVDWPDNESYWHTDEWNAYQGTGMSWWMADTAGFTPGGYENDWHVVLETDAISLAGTGLQLTFYHRYSMEYPDGASEIDSRYDGWDGINVRISLDGGLNWVVLSNPVPAYTCTSLWSFGEIHREGTGIPGWAGRRLTWTPVSFDLSAYADNTVKIRFDFASDGGYDTHDDNTMFGWQIDEIEVSNSSQVLYTNTGTGTNIRPYSIANWVGASEGKYRLRETARGQGIATINAESGMGFVTYVDFVQDTFPIVSEINRVGVSIHWASEQTYDYFLETFGRNSYDDAGGKIISYADWIEGGERNNAFWTGSFAAYGAGDGITRGSFGSVDVVGHELTHGLTDYSAHLVYRGESGALNESFSDIFGAAVEFYAEGRDQGDWLIGEDIYKNPGSIRSMQNPKALSDPDTYLGEYWIDTKLSLDFGGVHTNSGVQNYWFYLLTEGGTGKNDDGAAFQVTGIGLDDATAIAYRNLTNYLLPTSRYMDAAGYSILAAENLFGEGSQQVVSVRAAWEAVGIYMDPRLYTSDTLLRFEAPVNETEYRMLVLRNKGIEPLSISSFLFSDPQHFALQTPPVLPVQIDGGDSVRLWIIFSPEQDSLYEESLTIENSDPLNPAQTIVLSGLGTGNTTGLSETSREIQEARLSVSPNPFSERLLVSYALPYPDQVSIEIRDITGKLLYRSIRNASGIESLEILWSGLPESSRTSSGGIYLLSLRTSKQVLVKKIVKQ